MHRTDITPDAAASMKTPPHSLKHSSSTPLPADKANRLTILLNSALKEEKKSKKTNATEKDSCSESERIKGMERRLAMCIKEYKKYKEECLELKEERLSFIDEVGQLHFEFKFVS